MAGCDEGKKGKRVRPDGPVLLTRPAIQLARSVHLEEQSQARWFGRGGSGDDVKLDGFCDGCRDCVFIWLGARAGRAPFAGIRTLNRCDRCAGQRALHPDERGEAFGRSGDLELEEWARPPTERSQPKGRPHGQK